MTDTNTTTPKVTADPTPSPSPSQVTFDRLAAEFGLPAAEFDGMTLLYAAFGGFGNSAMCEVVYRKNLEHFEVKACHSPGVGFEGLWMPIRTEGHILKNYYAEPVARKYYEEVFGSSEMRKLDAIINTLVTPVTP